MADRLSELTVTELVQRLASDAPVPGGGSAAALTGSLAAALVGMVVALTAGRPAAVEQEPLLAEIRIAAAGLQSELLRLMELDAAAYDSVMQARRLPRTTELEREARDVQVQAAVREAIRAPLETAERASQLHDLAARLAPIGNVHAVSDVGVAGELAAAALRSALLNVEINLPYLTSDDELSNRATADVRELSDGLEDRERVLRRAVGERLA